MIKSIFTVLILFLTFTTAHAQLPIMPKPELPEGYTSWPSETSKLTIRPGLEAEKEVRFRQSPKVLLVISKINSEIVYVMLLETANDYPVRVTVYWLTVKGYVKLSGDEKQTLVIKDQISEAWQIWEKYVREKFEINDQEMAQLDEYLGL